MSFDKYVTSLDHILTGEKIFNIKFFIINDDIEKKVETAISMLCERYERPELPGIVYTCVKELMINGTKANLKRVLFEKNEINIDNENQYIQGMMDFRNALNENAYHTYLGELKEKDLWINVKFEYNCTGIRIYIVNNAHITSIEDRRLREKLKKAMKYEDIAQFYIDQGDELEGAGMGIALIVMLLRGMGIDPGLFRIGNTPAGQTFARIEIPLNDEYVCLRIRGNSV
ncbi:MAG: hypothetical protein A2014_11275 [Spirochaetes bacterium GWF1_49_6]|nr:MAG: hypothetical protein A2014_11275 [Spirochaetes bacterium GWF1_49_6]